MMNEFSNQPLPGRASRARSSGLSPDLVRVVSILAGFAGLALVLSVFAEAPAGTTRPPAPDWHGNVASSGR